MSSSIDWLKNLMKKTFDIVRNFSKRHLEFRIFGVSGKANNLFSHKNESLITKTIQFV